MAKENFYSNRLRGAERALYDECVANIERGVLETRCKIPFFNTSKIGDVVKAVLYGNPEFFFLDSGAEVGRQLFGTYIVFKNKYGGNIRSMRRELDAEIDRIVMRAKMCGSTYDRLCRVSAVLGERVRGINSVSPQYGDAYGALVMKEARCEGYAKAAKLILDRAGIASEILIGEADKDGKRFRHSWNMAYMNGVPYGFDFTWNDKGDGAETPGVEYLFLPDKDMHRDHFPEYDYPACNDSTQTFWARNNGCIRSSADLNNVKLGHIGNRFMTALKFDSTKAMQQMQSEAISAVMRLCQRIGKGNRLQYYINDRLNVISVYVTN